MKKDSYNEMEDELRPEYDLSKLKNATRGKYASKYREGTNLILLEPDVAEVFRDGEAVNEALRLLIKIADAKILKDAQPAAGTDAAGSAVAPSCGDR